MHLLKTTALVLLTALALAGCAPGSTNTATTTVTTTATELHPTLPIDPEVLKVAEKALGVKIDK